MCLGRLGCLEVVAVGRRVRERVCGLDCAGFGVGLEPGVLLYKEGGANACIYALQALLGILGWLCVNITCICRAQY